MKKLISNIEVNQKTKLEWMTLDPIIALGEAAYCTDNHEIRKGDGKRKFSELPFNYYIDYTGPHTHSVSHITNLEDRLSTLKSQLEVVIEDSGTVTGKYIGELFLYSGTIAPLGALKLDGTLQIRADYSELYNLLKDTDKIVTDSEWNRLYSLNTNVDKFSFGNGSTSFRLPNYDLNDRNWLTESILCIHAKNVKIRNVPLEIDILAELNDIKNQLSSVSVLPSGVIVIWSGYIIDIPNGWALCNGENGTPDLGGKFVMGANSDDSEENLFGVGSNGGAMEHAHGINVSPTTLTVSQIPPHNHALYGANDAGSVAVGSGLAGYTNSGIFVITGHKRTDVSAAMDNIGGGDPHSHNGNCDVCGNMPPYYTFAYIMKL